MASIGPHKGGVQRRYTFNEAFFETIDTEAKAFLLGFLSADGCVARGVLRIGVASRDRDILEKFLSEMEANYPIKSYLAGSSKAGPKCYPYSVLSFYSARLVRDLQGLGVTPRKSLTLQPWIGCQGPLAHHYWRGYWAGDGYIFRQGNKWSLGICSGSVDVIAAFADFVHKRTESKAKISHSRPHYYSLRVGGLHICHQLARVLFEDATISLDRKTQMAQPLLSTIPRRFHPCLDGNTLLAAHEHGESVAKIAKRFGLSEHAARVKIHAVGGSTHDCRRKYERDENGRLVLHCEVCGCRRTLKQMPLPPKVNRCKPCASRLAMAKYLASRRAP